MLEIIFIFLAASFWCFGFHTVVIKVGFDALFNKHFNDEWDSYDRYVKIYLKPLFACPYCMASFHGTIIYFTFVNHGIAYWPVFCVCLCGFNYLLSQIINE